MTQTLQVKKQIITTDQIIPLLTGYQMLPQLLQEVIIDQSIAAFPCTPEEKVNAYQQFYDANQLSIESEPNASLELHEITEEQLNALATRGLRIEKFKRATWGNQLESYFLRRKRELDKVIYSMIRTTDPGIARELYFRIQEGEQSFAELARDYSQGPEAKTAGLVGPVELGKTPLPLADRLYASQSGRLLPLMSLGKWVVIVRLEQLIPAVLDQAMRQQLLNELFERWVQEQLIELTSSGSISLN